MKRVDGIKYLLRKTIKYPHVDLQPVTFTYLDYPENDGFAAEVLKSGIEIKINQTNNKYNAYRDCHNENPSVGVILCTTKFKNVRKYFCLAILHLPKK
jgi:hypothetical protein